MKKCKKVFDLEKRFIKSFIRLYGIYKCILSNCIGFVLKGWIFKEVFLSNVPK